MTEKFVSDVIRTKYILDAKTNLPKGIAQRDPKVLQNTGKKLSRTQQKVLLRLF